jgi:hypothetical protein
MQKIVVIILLCSVSVLFHRGIFVHPTFHPVLFAFDHLLFFAAFTFLPGPTLILPELDDLAPPKILGR